MPRREKIYHFIYKTTNLVNEKYYIGMHSTDNLNDGYLGSGDKLRRSIKKYGKDNFKLEIIEMLPDRIFLKQREKELVNEELLKDPMCMNLKLGGEGGGRIWNELHGKKLQIAGNIAFKEKIKTDINLRNQFIERIKITNEKLNKNGNRNKVGFDWTGKKHTEESKRKIGEQNSLKQKGENNSQYGTMWITNGIENKKIKKDSEIPQGWYKGVY